MVLITSKDAYDRVAHEILLNTVLFLISAETVHFHTRPRFNSAKRTRSKIY